MEAFRLWENYFMTQMPAIPVSWSIELQAVNKRMANYTTVRGSFHDTALNWHLVGTIS